MKTKSKSAKNNQMLIKALTVKANEQWDEVCDCWQRTLDQVRQLGETLLEIKKYIPHGQWTQWIQYNCHVPYDTAKNYMWVAKHWNDPRIKEAKRSGMTFESIHAMHKLLRQQPPTVYDDVAEPPKTDEEINEEILANENDHLYQSLTNKFTDEIKPKHVLEKDVIFDNWKPCWQAFERAYKKRVCKMFGYDPYEEKDKKRVDRDLKKLVKELILDPDGDEEDEDEKNQSTAKQATYTKALSIRGDCLYCPLCLQIDSYWGCEPDCPHCSFRRLNRTWGTDLRPADPEIIRRKLLNGLKNGNPRSSLAHALHLKKTIRIGSKSDPYQPAELKYRVTRRILEVLIELKWSFVIQTRFTHNLAQDEDLLSKSNELGLLTLCPVISPGAEKDWRVLECKQTTPVEDRLKHIKQWIKKGYNVGVNGEPFIPGYHTPKQFRAVICRLKSIGVRSYNTYNLHANDMVYKNLAMIGLNIGKIHTMNQDDQWRPIQQELCAIAKDEGIILGCPDWVHTGKNWEARANTCCGVNVPRPSKFNTHYFKRLRQKGQTPAQIIKATWEGIGNKDEAKIILNTRHSKDYKGYTMADAGMK